MVQVQIYGARTLDDALALVEMGVDHLGLELFEDNEDQVAEIMKSVGRRTTISLLPLFDDPQQIVQSAIRLRPDIVHLCSSERVKDVGQIERLRSQLHPIQIMQAIPVGPPGLSHTIDSLGLAKTFDFYVDFLLLDTSLGEDQENPMPGWLGVTGRTHDWTISRTIVKQCESPVILAGGLDPNNVTDAIRAVRPWGVDACTGLDLYRGKKDLAKCHAFIERARGTVVASGE